MAGQVCLECGQIIKAGEKIIYEEGKPIHYPTCPAMEEKTRLHFWLNRLLQELDKAMSDEAEAIRMYEKLRTDIAAVFPPSTSAYETIRGIGDDETKHARQLSEVRQIVLKRKEEHSEGTNVLKRMPAKAYVMYEEARGIPKPSEVFPPSEKHKCFAGEHYFTPHSATTCSVCGWLVCTECGKCACDLSDEARQAIEAVWETFCINCRFKLHPFAEKIPLNMFLVWKAFGESAKKCASTLGVTVYDKTYMPKIAECVADQMKGMTADIIKSQHPEWVEEYKRLYL